MFIRLSFNLFSYILENGNYGTHLADSKVHGCCRDYEVCKFLKVVPDKFEMTIR